LTCYRINRKILKNIYPQPSSKGAGAKTRAVAMPLRWALLPARFIAAVGLSASGFGSFLFNVNNGKFDTVLK
jgi:hypothetical protein